MTQRMTNAMTQPETLSEQPETQPATTTFSPRTAAALASAGGGAWMRELSLTLALAAQAGIRLDEATLIYSDVRDLMALQRDLRRGATHTRR